MSTTTQPTVEDIEALVEEKVEEQTADLREELQEERRRRREAEEERDELKDRLENVEARSQHLLEDLVELEAELEELEDRLDSGDLAGDVQENADPDIPRETPLEDVVALPDKVAERELNENVQRARWFASRMTNAGKKTPAGYALTAGEIGRLLDVAVGVDPHPQTVARIISILDEMGGDQTTRRKRDGEKRIFVDEALAKRLKAHSGMSQEE